MGCYGSAGEEAGIDMTPYPAVRAWVERLHDAGISTDVEPYPPNAIAGAGEGSVHGV